MSSPGFMKRMPAVSKSVANTEGEDVRKHVAPADIPTGGVKKAAFPECSAAQETLNEILQKLDVMHKDLKCLGAACGTNEKQALRPSLSVQGGELPPSPTLNLSLCDPRSGSHASVMGAFPTSLLVKNGGSVHSVTQSGALRNGVKRETETSGTPPPIANVPDNSPLREPAAFLLDDGNPILLSPDSSLYSSESSLHMDRTATMYVPAADLTQTPSQVTNPLTGLPNVPSDQRHSHGGASTFCATSFASLLASPSGVSSLMPGDNGEMVSLPIGRAAVQQAQRNSTSHRVSLSLCGHQHVDKARAIDGHHAVLQQREAQGKLPLDKFLAPLPRMKDILDSRKGQDIRYFFDHLQMKGPSCPWLLCFTLAMSCLTEFPTTLEKVLRINRLSIHFLTASTLTLPALYNIVDSHINTSFHQSKRGAKERDFGCRADKDIDRFLSPEERLQLCDIHCEIVTCDAEQVDSDAVELGGCCMGEHPPLTTIAQLRKHLVTHAKENCIYLVNFDPYVVEQHELHLRSNQTESEEEAAAIMESGYWTANNRGSYGLLIDFNPVLQTVTLVTPHMSQKEFSLKYRDCARLTGKQLEERFRQVYSHLVLEPHTISLKVFYNAMSSKDRYTLRSRGFVRIFRSKSFIPPVPSIFPHHVVDGNSSSGLTSDLLDSTIAAHVLGLAMMHHLVVTFILTDAARSKQSSRNLLSRAAVCDVKLRGIPLTKVVQQLQLPLSVIVSSSDPLSVVCVYRWYQVLLQRLQVHNDVHLGLVLPERRCGAEDGMPNISDVEFLSHLRLVVKMNSIMLISFDINIALNVRIAEKDKSAHFAIVIGLDAERGIVRLADVNVKRFRKTWHVPLPRLYEAVMGYGYIVVSQHNRAIESLRCGHFGDLALQNARFGLPPQVGIFQRFEYPTQDYAATVIADAMMRLGFEMNVERFFNFSGFHLSLLLVRDISLGAAEMVAQNVSHYALDDKVSVRTTYYDYTAFRLPANEEDPLDPVNPRHIVRTEEFLMEEIRSALRSHATQKLIVKFDQQIIMDVPSVWNGNVHSVYAIVVHYDELSRTVVLSDGSANPFYRVWSCPLSLLFRAISSWDPVGHRARGTLLLHTDTTQEDAYENTRGYDMAHSHVHHPLKPNFTPGCLCLALAMTEMMMYNTAPSRLGGATLSHNEDDSQRYRRYNDIYSAEDVIYAFPKLNVKLSLADESFQAELHEYANEVFSNLCLPLEAITSLQAGGDVVPSLSEFVTACSGISGLMTITLISYKTDIIHGVPGCSVGVVNRVTEAEEGEGNEVSIQLLDGNPAVWGQLVERPAAELLRAMNFVMLIKAVECESDNDDVAAEGSASAIRE